MRAEDITSEHEDTDISILLAFWKAARGNNKFPSQANLDLITIPSLAPNVFIIDAEPNDVFRYRYMGTAIDIHLGINLTGRTFKDFRSGRVSDEITSFFKHVIDTPSMGILTTKLPSETRGAVIYTRVGLPVADDHQKPNKVVGLLLFQLPDGSNGLPQQPYDFKSEEQGIATATFGTL
mgnify:FL=1